MPIVQFDSIATLFREKASDRSGTAPPTGARSSSLSFSPSAFASQLVTQGQQAANSIASAGSGSNIPPQASAPGSTDAIRMRQAYGGHLDGDSRVGFILTSDLWREQGVALALHAGPASASWSLALRAADEEIKAGHARYAMSRTVHTSRGSGQTFFDFPKVSFQFQAGNLLPINGYQNEVVLPYGLEDFYRFFSLMNQPPMIPSGANEGKHNYVWIFYTSLQLPQATLKGYFDPQGISWEDTPDEATVRWNADFLVHDMSPGLWEVNELYSAYTDFMTTNGTLR